MHSDTSQVDCIWVLLGNSAVLAPTADFVPICNKKRVTSDSSAWKDWNWRSEGNLFLNGAFFTPSSTGASSLRAKPTSMVAQITSDANALSC
ncbi:putative pectate lyase 8 [Carex littledalei]|uniref:Putative pectate lyase 8 n=1 Tax=Carex littledalei TaxID=544730 RepID=A0A833QZF5_9POAL|nr:putative pectate lyase 8 [Carex littledalei]